MSNYSREEVLALIRHSLHHNRHHKDEINDLCEAVSQIKSAEAEDEIRQVIEKYDEIIIHLENALQAVLVGSKE